MSASEAKGTRAVVVAVQLPGVTDAEHASSVEELERLATTLGLEVVARVMQKRAALASAGVVGEGKLKELAELTGGSGETGPTIPRSRPKHHPKNRAQDDDEPGTGTRPVAFHDEDDVDDARDWDDDDGDASPDDEGGTFADAERGSHDEDEPDTHGGHDANASRDDARSARGDDDGSDDDDKTFIRTRRVPKPDVVLVDHDLSPSQARNLERATGCEVLDRTAVILAIFQRHAHTREAKLQVEIARLAYVAPRMRETGGGKDRQRGGIGGKGAGESAIELDRRKIRDRIAELREQLAAIEKESATRRARRAQQNTVALVGYTNAGKSSLMRALTGSDVYVADKLFATLDTTVRALVPETKPRILVSDTVGFIKKLPHDLVASFRSTLAEARDCDLLLHVVDGSDPAFRSQIDVTRTVLEELDAGSSPRWLLMNKADRLTNSQREALAAEFPDARFLSARSPEDVVTLHDAIAAFFESRMDERELVVPYSAQRMLGVIHERCRVLGESWDERGAVLRVRADRGVLDAISRELSDGRS